MPNKRKMIQHLIIQLVSYKERKMKCAQILDRKMLRQLEKAKEMARNTSMLKNSLNLPLQV
jgi:hypothetical protein